MSSDPFDLWLERRLRMEVDSAARVTNPPRVRWERLSYGESLFGLPLWAAMTRLKNGVAASLVIALAGTAINMAAGAR